MWAYKPEITIEDREAGDRAILEMPSQGAKVYAAPSVMLGLMKSGLVNDSLTLSPKGVAYRDELLRAEREGRN
jgi:hypothetical protein